MRRVHRVSAGIAVAALAAAGVGVAASRAAAGPAVSANHSTTTHSQPVPDAIRVPDGNTRIAVMKASGVQTYQCTNGAWAFVQPDAILSDENDRAGVLHTRGPVWTSVVDGSSVTAAAVASSPVPGAIPQLLLKATDHRVPGLLAAVTYVQRLDTTGGLAPAGACVNDVTASVPYTAEYAFWVAS